MPLTARVNLLKMASRLVDYFVQVGYGDEDAISILTSKELDISGGHYFKAQIMDRYPASDFPDCPIPDPIAMFCIPDGIRLTATPDLPIFFTFCLTLGNGDRLYGACLRFFETGAGVFFLSASP